MLYPMPMPELSIVLLSSLQSLLQGWGFPKYRAKQVLDWRNKGVLDPQAMLNVPQEIRAALVAHFGEPPLRLVQRQCASDGTRKYLFALREGGTIETVMIPERKRITVCLSSQLGCILDCPFCYTGRQNFEKNLTGAAIVAQLWMVKADVMVDPLINSTATTPTHLVYMGMGEPLANESGLHQSLAFFLDETGMHLSRRRITVSTSGLLPQITRLGEMFPVNLAISLHSAKNDLRNTLVPINKKYPLTKLRKILDSYPLAEQRYITLEYVMLAGINDQPEDLLALVGYVRKLRERINLIHFNPYPNSGYTATPIKMMDAFASDLVSQGVRATVRRSRGDDIMAACGQLNAHAMRQ
ncbi:MAG: 23S rRNA (adenine(2503)-C(2))-methyltransferase RlmN [Mariprofundaceae bacterium]|nr:23S rRNA (adenine(2503)-C(2))-methyltransferase RlmN [Mariprofundaceae bacterium]